MSCVFCACLPDVPFSPGGPFGPGGPGGPGRLGPFPGAPGLPGWPGLPGGKIYSCEQGNMRSKYSSIQCIQFGFCRSQKKTASWLLHMRV